MILIGSSMRQIEGLKYLWNAMNKKKKNIQRD